MGLTPLSGSHRPREATGYMIRELGPLFLVLMLPAALVLAVALQGGSATRPDESVVGVEPQASFRFESAGAGIRRLVHDGVGHRPGGRALLYKPEPESLAIEPDGSVLVCCEDPAMLLGETDSELYRLGDEDPLARWDDLTLGLSNHAQMEVAPDGTVWLAGRRLVSLEADGWQIHRRGKGDRVMAITADVTVWSSDRGRSPTVVRIRDDRQRVFRAGQGLPAATAEWDPVVSDIAVTSDGDVWVGVNAHRARRPGGLLHYDGRRWEIVRPLGRGVDARVLGLAVAPDGTLWAYLSRDARSSSSKRPTKALLARYDGRRWQVFREIDGVPHHGPIYQTDDHRIPMAANADGSLWLSPDRGLGRLGCGRLVSYRAGVTTDYFDDTTCVRELESAPDGSAWVMAKRGAADDGWHSTALYVVDPMP